MSQTPRKMDNSRRAPAHPGCDGYGVGPAEAGLAALTPLSADRRGIEIALLGAAALHALVLYVALPSARRPALEPAPAERPVRLIPLPEPVPPQPPPPPRERTPRIRERLLPVPDPTPEAPEPIRETRGEEDPAPLPSDLLAFPSPQAPPPVPSGGPERFIPGLQGVSEPVLELRIEPEYPAAARRAGLTGRVVLMARIGPDGAVADVEVISSTAPGVGFEQAAVEAVRRWVWRPAEVDGRPVAVSMTVVVQFSLH